MIAFKQLNMQRLVISQVSRRNFNFSPRLDMTFEGNKDEIPGTAEERMAHYFGAGRLRGEPPKSSSRRIQGDSKMIAGVEVPSKPVEPDNCCMSGCVNCVWELFNDDLRRWRRKRKEAAHRIKNTEEVWPADWNPPLSSLSLKNVPESLKSEKIRVDRQHENQKRKSVSSLFPERKGPLPKSVREAKKRNLARRTEAKQVGEKSNAEAEAEAEAEEVDDEEGWQNVPVYIRAFAEFERHKKLQKLAQQKQQQEKEHANQAEIVQQQQNRQQQLQT
ncbi:YPL107W [Zygosaccharomyces parabailii]|uniref:BN860_09670g1_1 n=1 Tax=Zygosaccharomyces bailii (strain CLIB 213 / ATCC 58445 / CBS 680 / BCRC 21525 / NBRC 1098 / NCYC 1416 / NRRL Y-2227) TaxID=1333698 RepID=A0A8J2T556_ZYGB2|nr:YPL107W [Zygosaccharomyces parabailii]CDF88412.1 BN860_09670g1_1 [Zygosaccharomyces bailii CLIB 213]CDH14704.1 related to UPF0651 protein YPL107W,mitochondrial [Zygosaccharomyces bailii ISA1307]SJM82061.1 related to UPF0651 protein YPL107W, mitochondrial [Zygosaccharomyces bailii]